jgi:hypothetical protein
MLNTNNRMQKIAPEEYKKFCSFSSPKTSKTFSFFHFFYLFHYIKEIIYKETPKKIAKLNFDHETT